MIRHRPQLRHRVGLALSLIVAFVLQAIAGPISLGRTVKKPSFGYSIRIPDGWDEIPPEPSSPTVGRFLGHDPMGDTPAIEVRRFKRESAPVKGYGGGKDDEKKKEPKSLEATLKELAKQVKAEMAPPKEVKIDKLPARLFEFTFSFEPSNEKAPKHALLAASIPYADGEYAIVCEAGERFYKRDYRAGFLAAINSFRLISGGEALANDSSPEAERARKHALVKGIEGWYAVDTDNYVVLSDSPDKDIVRQIANDIEKIRHEVYEVVFPPVKPITAISVVRVCANQAEYLRYGGPPGTGGYWNDESEELVFFYRFQNQSKKKSKKNSLAVLYHEAFHQYIYYSVGEVAPHSWFNEGHGDFFAGSVKVGGHFEVQPFDWRVGVVKVAANTGKLVPLRKLLYYSQAEYYKNAHQNYAQGWAVVYFLRKVTKNPQWKAIPDAYFNYLKDHLPKKDPEAVATTEGEPPPSPEGKPTPPPTPPAADPTDPNAPAGEDGDDEDKPAPPKKEPKSEVEKRILKEAMDAALEGVDVDDLEKAIAEWVKKL
ncbi:MAG: hypothetical protein HY292_13305 [Planctomycetes bacterium]|nr:hypothetical protein [Planctomycetota bacterium]